MTWGTSPEMVTGIDGTVPAPEDFKDPVKSEGVARALQYGELPLEEWYGQPAAGIGEALLALKAVSYTHLTLPTSDLV